MSLDPHPFAYVMLKTHALRDQIDDDDKGRGRKHAYDIYAIVALLTERATVENLCRTTVSRSL